MALSDLVTARENLDSEILALSAKCADPRAYTIEGLTVARQRLIELLQARKALDAAISGDGSSIYEHHSRLMP